MPKNSFSQFRGILSKEFKTDDYRYNMIINKAQNRVGESKTPKKDKHARRSTMAQRQRQPQDH